MASPVSRGAGASELTREALAKVPGCEGGQAPIAVTAMPGGRSNAVFRVQTQLGSFVMRLSAMDSAALGVNRARELALHRAAAAINIAPTIVHADARGRFLITEHVAGDGWSDADMGDAAHLDRLGEVLRRLHEIPVPAAFTSALVPSHRQLESGGGTGTTLTVIGAGDRPQSPRAGDDATDEIVAAPFSLSPLLQQHTARAIQAHPGEAAALLKLLRRAESILAAAPATAARPPRIIHNDLHHTNLIEAGRRLVLVDWEYAAVADPLYDLGCLLAYYPQAEPYAARLLATTGLNVHTSVDELTDIAWIYVLLSYLWYRTRALLALGGPEDREAEQALRRRLES